MKEDAELVYLKYERKLLDLDGVEKQVNATLNARIAELDSEARSVKAVLFDAKLQFRSNEMKEETYQQIKVNTDELLEHVTNEKTEIGNVRTKLAAQTIENISAATATPVAAAMPETPMASEPAKEASADAEEAQAPEVAATAGQQQEEVAPTVSAAAATPEQAASELSWLNQVITK